jgi:hypothetical protein
VCPSAFVVLQLGVDQAMGMRVVILT